MKAALLVLVKLMKMGGGSMDENAAGREDLRPWHILVLSSIQAGEIPLHSNDIITNGEILYSFIFKQNFVHSRSATYFWYFMQVKKKIL